MDTTNETGGREAFATLALAPRCGAWRNHVSSLGRVGRSRASLRRVRVRCGAGGQRAVHCGTRAGHSEDEMAEGGEPLAVLAGLLRASAEDKARLEKRVDEEVERRREAVRGAQERADRTEGNAPG